MVNGYSMKSAFYTLLLLVGAYIVWHFATNPLSSSRNDLNTIQSICPTCYTVANDILYKSAGLKTKKDSLRILDSQSDDYTFLMAFHSICPSCYEVAIQIAKNDNMDISEKTMKSIVNGDGNIRYLRLLIENRNEY